MNSVKVALVIPESNILLSDACAPFNLGYLASYLWKNVPNTVVRIFDGVVHKNIRSKIIDWQPDIVGITATTPQAPFAYELAESLRRTLQSVIVIGGIHATVMPEEALSHCDCVVKGEGELALVDIVQKYKNHAMKAVLENPIIDGKYIENLDEIPSPAFGLIDMREYLKHGPAFSGLENPIMNMLTSRGCPFRCPFCHNSFRRYKPRYFSAQRIVDEIVFFIAEYGIKSVWFSDDEFFANKERLRELAVLFERYGVNKQIVWGCQARAKSINPEILQLAKSMGCVVISIGFESASPRVLDFLKCGTTTVEDNERALRLAKEAGVTMGGSFIFGIPGETSDEMNQTFKWIEDNWDLKFMGVNTIIPYPKTKIWDICKEKGLLPENVDYARLVPTVTPKDTYIVNDMVDPEEYSAFIIDIHRRASILTQTRLNPSLKHFLKNAKMKRWWWLWLKHPYFMAKVLKHTKIRNAGAQD